MSISPVTGSPLEELARTLMRTFDTNQDGQLGADEFGAMLGKLLGPAGSFNTTEAAGTVSERAPARYAPLEGFDPQKLSDPDHTTPKYLFARTARTYDLSGVKDKASAEALLRTMADDFKAAGLQVLDYKGDSIKIKDDDGQEAWIDVIRGANSGSPAWQWLDTRY